MSTMGFCKTWNDLPELVLINIYKFLKASDVLNSGSTCITWNSVSYDNHVWRKLLYCDFKINPKIPILEGQFSFYEEYKRLVFKTPSICTETLNAHSNQVLHVSFSHSGAFFATCSKDGQVIVWESSYPAKIKFRQSMKGFRWKYTQHSQFNQLDTLLLVSGVHFGSPNSTSGEIAVFSINGELQLQCRVGNKPYDIFGTWIGNSHLISGDLACLGAAISATTLWINKAYQETSCEKIPLRNKLFKFYNPNASSVRSVMVADLENEPPRSSSPEEAEEDGSQDKWCDIEQDDLRAQGERLLIFTHGSKTFSPHMIGLKRISDLEFPRELERRSLKEVLTAQAQGQPAVGGQFDVADRVIDMHGHIVGAALSPDQRFLYVNVRCWPEGYSISDPYEPPPIAQEIQIEVIDLQTQTKVPGKIYRGARAFTPNNECFFIFLDVGSTLVASGAEDRFGYIWDRHYGTLLTTLAHSDVVNSVAFNPADPEMLVSVSDDLSIKIWRSKSVVSKLKRGSNQRVSQLLNS